MQQVAQFHLAPFNPDTVQVERSGKVSRVSAKVKMASKAGKRDKKSAKAK